MILKIIKFFNLFKSLQNLNELNFEKCELNTEFNTEKIIELLTNCKINVMTT